MRFSDQLLAFITLDIWTIQLGALLFTAIDRTFPNPVLNYPDGNWAIRNMADALASIIVGFPLFLLVTLGILRGAQRQPERLESSVRKWLTDMALVIHGQHHDRRYRNIPRELPARRPGHAIRVEGHHGPGDLWRRTYYLDSLRRDRVSSTRNRSFAVAALALVGCGVFGGFVHIGSPAVQRSAAEDTRRLFDLSSLAQALHGAWLGRGPQHFVLSATTQDLQTMALRMGARPPRVRSGYEEPQTQFHPTLCTHRLECRVQRRRRLRNLGNRDEKPIRAWSHDHVGC